MPPNKFLSKIDKHSSPLYIPNVVTKASGKWSCELLQGTTRLTLAEITLKIGEHRKTEEAGNISWA